jgi:hypothetical protein
LVDRDDALRVRDFSTIGYRIIGSLPVKKNLLSKEFSNFFKDDRTRFKFGMNFESRVPI